MRARSALSVCCALLVAAVAVAQPAAEALPGEGPPAVTPPADEAQPTATEEASDAGASAAQEEPPAAAEGAPGVLPPGLEPADAGADADADPEEEERKQRKEKYDRERFAQYARNYFTVRLAPMRMHVSANRKEFDLWAGRVDGSMVIPFEDGASAAWWMLFGLGGGPVDKGFVWSFPVSFAYGFRSPTFMGYVGGTFGLGGLRGESDGTAGPLYGGLAALGVSLGRVQLFFEGRFEGVLLRAGQSYTQYSYGPVLTLVL